MHPIFLKTMVVHYQRFKIACPVVKPEQTSCACSPCGPVKITFLQSATPTFVNGALNKVYFLPCIQGKNTKTAKSIAFLL